MLSLIFENIMKWIKRMKVYSDGMVLGIDMRNSYLFIIRKGNSALNFSSRSNWDLIDTINNWNEDNVINKIEMEISFNTTATCLCLQQYISPSWNINFEKTQKSIFDFEYCPRQSVVMEKICSTKPGGIWKLPV